MEIISRQQAITECSNRYFTGIPCKRGHMSQRYTKTANCIDCIHPKFENALDARSVAIGRLERFKMGMNSENLEKFKESLYLLSFMREPSLQPEDVLTKSKPIYRGGTFHVYSFRGFPEDLSTITDIANGMGL